MVRGTASRWWLVVGHCREVSDLHCNGLTLALLGGDRELREGGARLASYRGRLQAVGGLWS